jgi:hypothetical protein
VRTPAQTGALAAGDEAGSPGEVGFGNDAWSADCETSGAVSRNRSSGNPAVFRVQADRFDHEIEFVVAIDLARYAVGHAGPDELGFGEVVESINSPCIAVLHEEHGVSVPETLRT